MGAIKLGDAKHEAWHRGRLGWKLHAAQRVLQQTFEEATGQLFVANCSRQWGKSYWAVTKAIEMALSGPKKQIRYGAAFQSDLEEFIIPAFDLILEDCPQELRPKFNVKTSSYIFHNRSRIKLVGVDKKPNGMRGNTLDLIIGDEVGFWTHLDYIYKSVIIPSTLHRPNCRIILISTPPSTPAHPFTDYVQKAMLEGGYVELDIYTNPLIGDADIERMAKELGGYESTSFRRECLCEFVTDSDSAIIKEWDDKYIGIIERDEYFTYYRTYVGMDMGRKDFTTLLFGYYDFKKAALFIEDEITMHGPAWTTITLKDDIKKKEKELWWDEKLNEQKTPFRRVADNNNPHLIMDLNQLHDIHFLETTKESLEAMVNELRIFVGQGRLIVHPRCKMLIGSLKFGVWDEKRREFARSPVYGHFDHLAALIYLVRNLSFENTIPKGHGYVNHKAWMGYIKGQDKSENAQRLEKVFSRKRPPINRR